MRAKLSIALSALAVMIWAVPHVGAAPFFARERLAERDVVASQPVRFRTDKDRGLLVRTWINNSGPYVFVIDTGAGMNIVGQRLVNSAGLKVRASRQTLIGGLSGATTSSNREALIETLALGTQNNLFPGHKTALVIGTLPFGVDGILDPTEAFAPYGYSIDLPRAQLALLSESERLSHHPLNEGATVAWLRNGDSDRPFVRLGDGRFALIDTGSRFGLAVGERQTLAVRKNNAPHTVPAWDLGGGAINARRVAPTTISIGELVLRRIPTDILSGVAIDAPVILGREALAPFKISFDSKRRLIEFEASER